MTSISDNRVSISVNAFNVFMKIVAAQSIQFTVKNFQ